MSTESSSAAICASVVAWPWPLLQAPVSTMTFPDGSTRTVPDSYGPKPVSSTKQPKPIPMRRPSARARSRSAGKSAWPASSAARCRQVG